MTAEIVTEFGSSVKAPDPGDWERQIMALLFSGDKTEEEKLAVVPAAEMSPVSFAAHLRLRHTGPLRECVPGAHLWAHSVDHHLYAAQLDHTHRDLPDEEEMRYRAEEGEARLRRYALAAARKDKDRQDARRRAYAIGEAS